MIFLRACVRINRSEIKVSPLPAFARYERLIFKEDNEMDLAKALNSQYMKEELP